MGIEMDEIHNLLIVGIDIVSLAASANRAGYEVFTADYFGDQDLKQVSKVSLSIIMQRAGCSCGRMSKDYDPATLLEAAKRISEENRIDAVLLSTGLDDSPQISCELSEIAPIIGNTAESIMKVRDKESFFSELERLRVSFPETMVTRDLGDTEKASQEIGYPVIIKPMAGFGGTGIRKARNRKELRLFFESLPSPYKIVIQRYIPGIAASVSVISYTQGAVALTVNEQLVGLRWAGQKEPFGYCGNIVPLSMPEETLNRCKRLAERIVHHFGLVGSNGVDFVVAEDGTPYVVEVNPRFQGTLECVERALGVNLVDLHMKACTQKILPRPPVKESHFCIRLILFTPLRSVVPDLKGYTELRDVPLAGSIVEEGEPLCSVITEGEDRRSSLDKVKKIAGSIFRSLKPI